MTTLTIVHFNDVYNIEPGTQEPVGGAARFVTAVHQLSDRNPLILFSGDALNPSLMSTVTLGHQMVPVLNAIGVHCALYGNHDFDFGVENLVKFAKKTNFPWLMSNVYDAMTGDPLADGQTTYMIEWNGKKIGIIGLIEEDWIATLATLDPEDLEYLDFVTEGRRLARTLKEQGADYVIALTHMRWPNDTRLAENVEEIDVILGGHDHDFLSKTINGKLVLKSGTDFRNYSVVTVTFHSDGRTTTECQECRVDSSIVENEEVKTIVDDYQKILGDQLDTVIGRIGVDLDGRFESIRRGETNLGNFVTSIMLKATDADVALLNSGTLRSDRIHPRGDFRLRDLVAILPMVETLVVIELSGEKLVQALENGVSKYPALEGRFLQVAGISYSFDPRCPPGSRIVRNSVSVQNEALVDEQLYRVCTKGYIASGKDGFDCLVGARCLVDEEDGPIISTIVQNHFKSVEMMLSERSSSAAKYSHHQSIIPVKRRKSIGCPLSFVANVQADEDDAAAAAAETDAFPLDSVEEHFGRLSVTPSSMRLHRRRTLDLVSAYGVRRHSIQHLECGEVQSALSPKVEGRIRIAVQ